MYRDTRINCRFLLGKLIWGIDRTSPHAKLLKVL